MKYDETIRGMIEDADKERKAKVGVARALATVPVGPGEPSEAAIDAAWRVPSQPFTGLDTARDNIRAMLRAAYAAERAALAGAASPSQKGRSDG